jgi:hypothetical protein
VPATVPFGNITKILQLTPSRFLVLPLWGSNHRSWEGKGSRVAFFIC